jgi:hypothetical protein
MNRIVLIAKLALVAVVVLAAALYVGDYVSVRIRMANSKANTAFSTVTIERLLAIPLKGGRTEYELDAQQPEETLPCVRALFPHLGYMPCWYLKRKAQEAIPMFILYLKVAEYSDGLGRMRFLAPKSGE